MFPSSIGVGGTEPLYDLKEIFKWIHINGVTERSEGAHPATERSEGAHPATKRSERAPPSTELSEGASPNDWSEIERTPNGLVVARAVFERKCNGPL